MERHRQVKVSPDQIVVEVVQAKDKRIHFGKKSALAAILLSSESGTFCAGRKVIEEEQDTIPTNLYK
jgi:hypothetical protein